MIQSQRKNILAYAICTLGGLGYFPKMPGTFASALATLAYFLISPAWNYLIFGMIIFFMLGILFTHQVEATSQKDPGIIIIDEVVGQWSVFLFITQNNLSIIITGFILFRLFDILKPWGIHSLQKYKSGWGVMLDDLLAGIYASIILQILIFLGVFG